MASSATIKVRMISSADTGYFRTTTKNVKTHPEKMVLNMYDPVIRKHVPFKEGKIK